MNENSYSLAEARKTTAPMVGRERTIELEGRTITYEDVGEGPPIVFVHGVFVTGSVWDDVVAALVPQYRCIVPTLPLGVHAIPSPPDVDRSPHALARAIAGLLDALDLRDVTLVGNDTGGALCQLVIAEHPDRVARLVLTNCDAFEAFPPRLLEPLYLLARVPATWWALAQLCRLAPVQRAFFATVARTQPDPNLVATLMERFARISGVREDLRQTVCAIDKRTTLEAAQRFASFEGDVLVLWGTDDIFFPVSLARRLAEAFPHARLELVERARTFVQVDAPQAVAAAVSTFIAQQKVA